MRQKNLRGGYQEFSENWHRLLFYLCKRVLPSDTLLCLRSPSNVSDASLSSRSSLARSLVYGCSVHHCDPTDMPKRERSLLYFPRQKEGEDVEPGSLTRHIRVNYTALERLFHLNLKDAARELGEANPVGKLRSQENPKP